MYVWAGSGGDGKSGSVHRKMWRRTVRRRELRWTAARLPAIRSYPAPQAPQGSRFHCTRWCERLDMAFAGVRPVCERLSFTAGIVQWGAPAASGNSLLRAAYVIGWLDMGYSQFPPVSPKAPQSPLFSSVDDSFRVRYCQPPLRTVPSRTSAASRNSLLWDAATTVIGVYDLITN